MIIIIIRNINRTWKVSPLFVTRLEEIVTCEDIRDNANIQIKNVLNSKQITKDTPPSTSLLERKISI